MKIHTLIYDADLRKGHDGLAELAKDEFKTNVHKLAVGEYVMFVNTSQTVIKIYCANNYILHYKHPDGRRLNMRAILALPAFIQGQSINYDAAVAAVIKAQFSRKSDRE